MESESISKAIDWRGPQKLAVIEALTKTFDEAGVDSVADLAGALADEERGPELRRALRRIAYVGPKTVDYIAVLAGSAEHVAVDMHIKGFAREAGVSYWNDYSRVSQLVKETAEAGGWSTGALDAAIWRFMSERGTA
jgi:endonuclease III